MGERPKPSVRPVKVHVPDRELHTTRVRGVGFRADDGQGWRGPRRGSYADARADLRQHRAEQP